VSHRLAEGGAAAMGPIINSCHMHAQTHIYTEQRQGNQLINFRV
jgi:endonuclease IV